MSKFDSQQRQQNSLIAAVGNADNGEVVGHDYRFEESGKVRSDGIRDAFAAGEKSFEDERLFTIGNDVLEVTISDIDGGIKSAALKKYRAIQDKPDVVVFNEGIGTNALAAISNAWSLDQLAQSGKFSATVVTENGIRLVKTLPNGCTMARQYVLAPTGDRRTGGYVIRHEMELENTTNAAMRIGDVAVFLGTMPATVSDISGDYLNFGTFDGAKDKFIGLRDFKASNGFLGFGKKSARKKISAGESIQWGSVKNQFFTAILTPETEADGYAVWPIFIQNKHSKKKEEGIAASMIFSIDTLGSGEKRSLSAEFYVGPKDFSRLSVLGKEQDRVMQFGFFGSISEFLLRMMLKIHSVVPNWGLTIIALTTIVKILLWPLTNAQVKSSKKMSAIQEPLKQMRERFKNNPQKLQAETLKLFRENHINPAAGCLPVFIQIPILFGLYYMLRTASDLRFARFLWIKDLSLPDTIAHVGTFPVNPLPFLMGITMFLQMHMTPMPTSDGFQKWMFKLMPAIFLLGCYSFPSGLVLYWTVQNLLTITQQLTSSSPKEVREESSPARKTSTDKEKEDHPPSGRKKRKRNVRA
jgi:YidC/Oxa1 family membrane protein insertase